ncbi:hypothetical protein L202_07206 [Cryptococcus amylolentus CBS 6039]|uniref:Uncharacterized protein n=2 Tax=Cryptococcus amylolentus TaxID=104669 RepID=A0A1E3HBD7_9TREE|nr:hypothetical protein L202_07206 [Cryptococcus amylolentus CBS 6039]ODN73659.1 hypothetical protein L202_07206 [Cryptococcus amylolentus CBS 6039]ODO00446.1 hypothetical protein I350_07087 [Cryptococcus amylolentus CBS 6273]
MTEPSEISTGRSTEPSWLSRRASNEESSEGSSLPSATSSHSDSNEGTGSVTGGGGRASSPARRLGSYDDDDEEEEDGSSFDQRSSSGSARPSSRTNVLATEGSVLRDDFLKRVQWYQFGEEIGMSVRDSALIDDPSGSEEDTLSREELWAVAESWARSVKSKDDSSVKFGTDQLGVSVSNVNEDVLAAATYRVLVDWEMQEGGGILLETMEEGGGGGTKFRAKGKSWELISGASGASLSTSSTVW